MVIDIHTHICALGKGGTISPKIVNSIAFRFMRWRLGIRGPRETWPAQLEAVVESTINQSSLDAVVILAFDAVYDPDGRRNDEATCMYVANDYVAQLAARNPRILFGASIHPYRPDALTELERCIALGAVLVKWLPLTQHMDPADPRCFPFYDAMAHHQIPLLCHTGGEKTLSAKANKIVRDPARLKPALDRGVTVIAAHCGTRSVWGEQGYLDTFCQMAKDYPRFYGDTAAITLPNRAYCLKRLLGDSEILAKLVHGSDWPVLPWPRRNPNLWFEPNWLKRDILIKQRLGFDQAYFHRAASLLRPLSPIK